MIRTQDVTGMVRTQDATGMVGMEWWDGMGGMEWLGWNGGMEWWDGMVGWNGCNSPGIGLISWLLVSAATLTGMSSQYFCCKGVSTRTFCSQDLYLTECSEPTG